MTTDELLKQIFEKIDALPVAAECTYGGMGLQELFDKSAVESAIRSLPVFQPQEAKELPTGVGLWHRNGVTVLVMKSCKDRGELWAWYYDEHDGRGVSIRVSTMVKGGWLPVTPLTPSVKEPEPAPERKQIMRLCARHNGVLGWYHRFPENSHWQKDGLTIRRWGSELTDPHPDSDKEAVELWKKETEGKS